MRKILFIVCFLSYFSTLATAQNNTLQLAQNSNTTYVIALADDAIPAEKTAAEQFQKYFHQITGAPIEIKSEKDVAVNAPQILIGAGKRAKVLLPEQNWSNLGNDGIVIKTIGNKLILAGGRPRGTLYAVFQFLEDVAGCRWWTPTENTIPHKRIFDVSPQNMVYVPPFNYREHFTTEMRNDPIFATILRENGHFQTQNSDWGGHYTMLGFVHTFSDLLPPKKYFKDHPEWYSDPDNGNKPCTDQSKMPGAQQTQLNLSDPAMLDELTKQALIWIEKNPQAGYISISQNDNYNYCHDAASMKLAEEEGSQSAPLLNFVNKVAARIHQQYPDFKVETLAYLYTEKPPKTIRPAKNVLIRLAPLSADFGHLLNSDWNVETRDSLLAWAKIAPDLFVWNYVANFSNTVLPHPNWAGLADDLRFFAANNVRGIFEQGDDYTNGVGDFVQLRTWLIGQLMWNPKQDQKKLINEFLQGYYGAAAPYLHQYLELVEKSFLAKNTKLSASNQDFSFITLDVANEAIMLFNQAEHAVQADPVLLNRVRRERLSLTAAMLLRYGSLQAESARNGKPFLGPKDPRVAMDKFIDDAKAAEISKWNETTTFDQEIPKLKGMFAPPLPLPDFAKDYPADNVIDLQSGQFRLYRDGTLTGQEKDTLASGETAAFMVGTTNEWAIQMPLGGVPVDTGDKWRVYVVARIERTKAPQTGMAFSGGAYDEVDKKTVFSDTISLSAFDNNDYQVINLGAHLLNGSTFLWLAPTRNPAIEKIYVDRILLIREGK